MREKLQKGCPIKVAVDCGGLVGNIVVQSRSQLHCSTVTGLDKAIARTILVRIQISNWKEIAMVTACGHTTVSPKIPQQQCEFYANRSISRTGNRRKALCCTPNPAITRCGKPLCQIDRSYRCGPDPYADESEEGIEIPNPLASSLSIRSDTDTDLDDAEFNELEERGRSGGRRVLKREVRVRGNRHYVRVVARNYPGPSRLHRRSRGPAASDLVFR